MNKLIVLIKLAIFISFFANSYANDDKLLYQAQKFKYILETVEKHYADSVDIEKFCDKTFANMLKSLDVQSVYFSAEDYKKIRESYSGTNFGIGLETVKLSDTLFVYEVYKNTSADSAGLMAGDKILFINGINTKDLSKNEANDEILGDTNTTVNLIIRRGQSNSLTEYMLQRMRVELPSVKASFIIDGTDIGYLSYSNFSDISDTEFIENVKILLSLGMKKMLLDLRGNPGGYLNKAGVIADQFIGGEKLITYTESRNPENTVRINSTKEGLLQGLPLIVLIDKNSASGSEIIAGAVQDYDLGLVVGETSFGKGSVQKLWNINDGSAFRITVGKYHTPVGRCIQKEEIKGNKLNIDPSMELSQSKSTIDKVQELLEKTGGKTHLPVFKTSKGRTVIGAGGIIPDYFVQQDTLTMLTNYLKSRGVFLEWAFTFISANSSFLKVQFGDNSKKFNKDWQISNDMLKEFVNLAVSKKLWNETMFVKDKMYIINYMKASVADLLFGHNEYYKVLLGFDNQLQEAILKFNEAENLLSN